MIELKDMRVEDILDRAKDSSICRFLEKNRNKKIALYGAGRNCKQLLHQLYGITDKTRIELIVDRSADKAGSYIENIGVRALSDLDEIEQYAFIITITNVYSAICTLKEIGVSDSNIYYPTERICYLRGTSAGFNSYHSYLSPIDMIINREKYIDMYDLLSDDKSKTIFKSLLWFRLTGEIYQDRDLYNKDDAYFSNPNVVLSDEEDFIDVGAYTGDSIIEYLKLKSGKYSSITAIEANSVRCASLKDMFKNIENFEVIEKGVGIEKATIQFDGMCAGAGGEKIEIDSLDEILKDKSVSIIKMDIEGMERDALMGAKETIRRQKPLLAICIYHLATDIWYLGKLINEIGVDYKYFIDQPLNADLSETVLYAVPDAEQ